ncbi:MAG: ABC transporter ATP-binding protein [Planctomycetota bacterium]
MTPISLRQLHKTFGPTTAVDRVDLEIPAGELFFLLGPSGCGKTTLLRMIAGFIDPTAGSIHFGPRDVTALPANRRNTGMVFQGYALWPHMTVRQNVAFGLEVRKRSKTETARRVDRVLDSVQLTVQADRKINQLSGGQQQRVALARALVIEPTVLLLDEPLSNLDAKLRLEMRQSIRQVCKSAGITAVYVTHDQQEALSMADRIALLDHGRLQQVGPPRKLYRNPARRFVADFLGEANFISARVTGRIPAPPASAGGAGREYLTLDTPLGPLHAGQYPDSAPTAGEVTCCIRPESITLTQGLESTADPAAAPRVNLFPVAVAETVYLGELTQQRVIGPHDTPLKVLGLSRDMTSSERSASPGSVPSFVASVAPRDVVILRD